MLFFYIIIKTISILNPFIFEYWKVMRQGCVVWMYNWYVNPLFNELYLTYLLYLGCGYYFNYLHCPVDRSVDPQHFALLRQEGREQQRERLSALCSTRSNLHVLVHLRIPGENPSVIMYFQNSNLNIIVVIWRVSNTNLAHRKSTYAPEVDLRGDFFLSARIFLVKMRCMKTSTRKIIWPLLS